MDEPAKFKASKLVFGLATIKAGDRKSVEAELRKTAPPPHLQRIDPDDPKFIRDKSLPEVGMGR